MKNEFKSWEVTYDHKDGRSGTLKVETEVTEDKASKYGNGKSGCLRIGTTKELYDLRYEHGDPHKAMIESYFGTGLIEAKPC